MHICMVTPHLPPYQSANAILPQLLANKLKSDKHKVSFIVPSNALDGNRGSGEHLITSINMERQRGSLKHKFKLDLIDLYKDIKQQTKQLLDDVDLVHLHSNGLLHQMMTIITERRRIPQILTHYGTEIWHYKKKRFPILDPFLYINKSAESVVYYSRKLQEYSSQLGIDPDNPVTIYPPAADEFKKYNDEQRSKLRKELGIKAKNVLVNVKRLHPLGGHEYLLKSMPEILSKVPKTHLYICGDGELRDELEKLSKKLKIDKHITFLGIVDNTEIWKYYAAADAYVLTSVLEALPTVAVEALACGTKVVITDTPGGKELADIFSDEDLRLVPMKDTKEIAQNVIKVLQTRERTSKQADEKVNELFRINSMYKQYLELYKAAIG